MKKYFSFLCLFIIVFSFSQSEFITVWKPSNLNSLIQNNTPSNSNQIWFPGRGTDFSVSWEEVGYPAHNGNLSNVTSTENFLIDFGTAQNPVATDATYRVKISNGSGTFTKIKFSATGSSTNFGDTKKLLKVEQWGTTVWQNMENAFAGCSNMDISATDTPDLSQVTSLYNTFASCQNLVWNPSVNYWDTSHVTTLFGTFSLCWSFNQPINNWNTANITVMDTTFQFCKIFNQPLDNWNTGNVISMNAMFLNASKFNSNIATWDLHSCTDMEIMFANATDFNQPIGNWNVSNVYDFRGMFRNAKSFNQPIGTWNTASGQIFGGMFQQAINFNQPIGNWNMTSAAYTGSMFDGATAFNQPIGNWNFTSNILGMSAMFQNASSFNQNIENWNVASVVSMSSMFLGATAFNQDIGNWNTSSLVFTNYMFSGAASFNQKLHWNTSLIQNMDAMFLGASSFNQSIGNFDLSSLVSAYNILQNSGLNCQNYDDTLYKWNANPNTPNDIMLQDQSPMVYSNSLAVSARNNLINAKNWVISGDTYNPNCESLLGTAENNFENFGVYPNPATDFIFVKTSGKIKNYSITDASGRQILEGKNSNGKIDVSKLNAGIFILKINDSKTVKLIKK